MKVLLAIGNYGHKSNRMSIEASAAQDAMTAIIKAFHKDVDDVESVMDKLVTVGKRIAQSCSNAA